jgi:hypothetical protein
VPGTSDRIREARPGRRLLAVQQVALIGSMPQLPRHPRVAPERRSSGAGAQEERPVAGGAARAGHLQRLVRPGQSGPRTPRSRPYDSSAVADCRAARLDWGSRTPMCRVRQIGTTAASPQGKHHALRGSPLAIGCRKQGGQPPANRPVAPRGKRDRTPCAASGTSGKRQAHRPRPAGCAGNLTRPPATSRYRLPLIG